MLCLFPLVMNGTWIVVGTSWKAKHTFAKKMISVYCLDNITHCNLAGMTCKAEPAGNSSKRNKDTCSSKLLEDLVQEMMRNAKGVGDFSQKNRLTRFFFMGQVQQGLNCIFTRFAEQHGRCCSVKDTYG